MVNYNLVSLNEKLINVSIVRNPYHRTVSLFKYFGGRKKWNSFENFLKLLEGRLSEQYFYKPQHTFLTYKNKVAIDNLIKFENYKIDVENFRAKHDLEFEVTFNTEMQIKKSKANFEKFYSNKANLNRVEKIYEKDFELFKYNYVSP